jgi:hypothetical protein
LEDTYEEDDEDNNEDYDDDDDEGEFHHQREAKWIVITVIRGQLRGHSDTPFGRPTPSWPIGAYFVDSVTINKYYYFLTLSP